MAEIFKKDTGVREHPSNQTQHTEAEFLLKF